jgi:hypothetical protein
MNLSENTLCRVATSSVTLHRAIMQKSIAAVAVLSCAILSLCGLLRVLGNPETEATGTGKPQDQSLETSFGIGSILLLGSIGRTQIVGQIHHYPTRRGVILLSS